ncbi:hypothetical protein VTK73DRAFT_5100 [Phialemonium thermophilum]|uniref:CCZ1/INTU/HSP4 first Longin domain-containing protein n=1 Tax=Phialemonium thermophilum TaxID=223376 RepID=A0ABR3WQ41_9PEZI
MASSTAAAASTTAGEVVPAHLGFLAIYNPSLGTTDETIDDQIVFYYDGSGSNGQTPRHGGRRQKHRRQREQQQRREQVGHDDQGGDGAKGPAEQRNERLRQIGLAQAMVEFGRGFSGGAVVDTVDTEKTRVVIRELEPGWWILASINLTRLPSSAIKSSGSSNGVDTGRQRPSAPSVGLGGDSDSAEGVEYSAREVKPPVLLVQDLLRAHSLFLLHHGSSLASVFAHCGDAAAGNNNTSGSEDGKRQQRSTFGHLLGTFWNLFLSTWNVTLHGNPARDVFGGIKIAACGELGVGVGEEDRGSGEREVLEGLVERVDGLVDLVVSKFGEEIGEDEDKKSSTIASVADGSIKLTNESSTQWLGSGREPGAEDGAVFLGVGALTRQSLRDISLWMEDLYTWGQSAYGVQDVFTSPKATRRKKKATASDNAAKEISQQPNVPATAETGLAQQIRPDVTSQFGLPPPLIGPERRAGAVDTTPSPHQTPKVTEEGPVSGGGGMDKVVSYLKMGYGTYWSLGSSSSPPPPEERPHASQNGRQQGGRSTSGRKASHQASPDDAAGYYLIGLVGEVDESDSAFDTEDNQTEEIAYTNYKPRIIRRTLVVEPARGEGNTPEPSELGDGESQGDSCHLALSVPDVDDGDRTPLRVVVYVNKPFIFTFLFRPLTDALADDTLYRSLHCQLAPLRKHLIRSTAYRPDRPEAGAASPTGRAGPGAAATHIYDLIWDPLALTVHSTIPNIPDAGIATVASGVVPSLSISASAWTRAEALSTHTQILNQYSATRTSPAGTAPSGSEFERTVKTMRGWWIVWSRVAERETVPAIDEADENAESDHDGAADQEGGAAAAALSAAPALSRKLYRRLAGPDPAAGGAAKEIFLVRKARDQGLTSSAAASGSGRSASGSYFAGGRAGTGWWAADGASRLAQGIGVDTRKYIEGLLSLNR